jgi:D-alanine-D-alanine ligase
VRVAVCASRKGAAPPPGASADHDAEWDSPATVDAVARVLATRHEVVGVVEADAGAAEEFRRLRPDLVFNMAECAGGRDREGRIPSILELLGIPYTGSDPVTLGIGLDKYLCNKVLAAAGVPVPRSVLARVGAPVPPSPLPAVVKPVHEGSGIGVRTTSLVRTRPALLREVRRVHRDHRQDAVVESFLPGREFTVAALGNGRDLRVLPIVEILLEELVPEGQPLLYGYEAKWTWDTPDKEVHACPARIPAGLRRALEAGTKAAFEALGCRDWARIDWRCDRSGTPRLVEANPLPGIIPDPEMHSCFPAAARAAGMEFDELVLAVADAAARRSGLAGR